MTEMFLRSLAAACILLFTVMVFYYIAVHRDYQSSILHRAWNLLQYGCLKALIAFGYGREAVRIRLVSALGGSRTEEERMKKLYRREQRLAQLRSQRSDAAGGYGRKAGYNLKILN